MLSVRVPRDVDKKISKFAEAANVTKSDAVSFFLQKGCKQPPAKTKRQREPRCA